MKKVIIAASIIIAAILSSTGICAQSRNEPSGTYVYATKDSVDLFLDVYEPAKGSQTRIGDRNKPAIIFLFGGGFMGGSRHDQVYDPWFAMLQREGYRVISIDYRLGLKGVKKVGVLQANLVEHAIHLAVEDLYSATNFLIDNADSFGIEPDNLVIAGSSAGAISVLQADWEIANGHSIASVLPEGFRYAGVMSFSGAIFSREGGIRYRKAEPAPTLFMHGVDDRIVKYGQIWFFNLRFAGTSKIVPTFEKHDYNYNVLRYKGNGHEISMSMVKTFEEQIRFLETNVVGNSRRTVDALIDDPSIPRPKWGKATTDDLYKGQLDLSK